MDSWDYIKKAIAADDPAEMRKYVTAQNINDLHRGERPFIYAAEQQKHACIKACLELGAELMGRYKERFGPVIYVCHRPTHVDTLRILLEAGASPNDSTMGESPLEIALINNAIECASVLIEYGANVRPECISKSRIKLFDMKSRLHEILKHREQCRSTALLLLAIHRCRLTTVSAGNDYNVMKLAAKHVWSERLFK